MAPAPAAAAPAARHLEILAELAAGTQVVADAAHPSPTLRAMARRGLVTLTARVEGSLYRTGDGRYTEAEITEAGRAALSSADRPRSPTSGATPPPAPPPRPPRRP